MKKDKLIYLIQAEISSLNQSINENNLSTIVVRMQEQLNILSAIDKATFLDADVPLSARDLPAELSAGGPKAQEVTGYFKQLLRGGMLDLTQPVPVPEAVVRQLNLRSGDLVRATLTSETVNVQNTVESPYQFEVLDRSCEVALAVREVKSQLLVQQQSDSDQLYIEFNDDSGTQKIILLTDEDIEPFQLAAGDVVDYAHEINNPASGKIIWKYSNTENITRPVLEATTAKHKRRKFKPLFKGLKILTIGSKLAETKDTITLRAGDYRSLTGQEAPQVLAEQIQDADLIVVFNKNLSSTELKTVRQICKEYQKVTTYTKDLTGTPLATRLSLMKKQLNK